MLYPEEIYDLDTITLEEKTEELERAINDADPPPKQWLRTLELARLEVEERRSIEQFALNLEQDLQLFDRYCMYPVKRAVEIESQPVSLPDNKEVELRKLTESSKTLAYRPQKKMDCSMLEVLKRTKINTGTLVIGRANDAPVVNHPFKKKRYREENKTQHQDRQQRTSVRNRAKSQSKIAMTPIMKEGFTQNANLLAGNQKPKISTIHKVITENSSRTAPSEPERTVHHSAEQFCSQERQPPEVEILNNQLTAFSLIEKKKLVQDKQPMPVKNNLKFVQNDIYTDSDEQENWKAAQSTRSIDDRSSTLATVEFRSTQQIQCIKESTSSESNKTTLDDERKSIIHEEIESVSNTQPEHSKEPLSQPTQPAVWNAIDYFRLTVPKNKKNNYTQEDLTREQKHANESIPEIIVADESPKQIEPIQPPQQIEEVSLKEAPETIPSVTLSSSRVVKQANPAAVKPQSINLRKTHTSFAVPVKLPAPIAKIMAELPPIVTEYHSIIPTFNHLFHPDADVVPLLWELIDALRQHIAKVSSKEHFRPNLLSNLEQFDSYVNGSMNKIRLYGSKVDLDLSQFERRDDLARMRGSGELPPPTERQIFYYRVVKTKQEVYDIMSSTFNRTSDWAELPHGLNLKNSWNMLWTWAKPQLDMRKLIFFQRVNHFPHNKHISRKDMLKKNIEKIKRLGPKTQALFDIMPESYLLPGENSLFLQRYNHHKEREGSQNLWIMKPIGMSRGRGISLVSSLDQVIFSEPVVLQKYLRNPLLLDGYKFDMRIYVLLTSVNPLEVYLYREGFARLSTEKYTLNENALSNNFVHLTNFAIQRQNYMPAGFSLGGTKWSLKMLREKLRAMSVDWEAVWAQVRQIVLKSCIAVMNEIPPNPNCFELFGYDIIIDSERKCWLLEVNSSPSLEREFLLDEIVKQQLIDDTVELLDVPQFDRARLLEVLERRALEIEGRKSLINPSNNTTLQLNRDLHYVLHGKPLHDYGSITRPHPNYEMLAPSPLYYGLVKSVQAYKLTSLIRKA